MEYNFSVAGLKFNLVGINLWNLINFIMAGFICVISIGIPLNLFNDIPYIAIDSAMFLFTLVVFSYIVFKINSLTDIVLNKVLNNVPIELDKTLFNVTKNIKSNTMAEAAFVNYLNKKLHDIRSAYLYLRNTNNYDLIFDKQFEEKLMGNGENELKSFYSYQLNGTEHYYPEQFLGQVNKLNLECYREFKDKTLMGFSNLGKADRIEVIKSNILKAFEKNVIQVNELFNATKHLIKDPDYVAFYGKEISLREFDSLPLSKPVTINTNDLKVMISRGIRGVGDALDLLLRTLPAKDDLFDYLVKLNLQYENAKRGEHLKGENSESAYNRIAGALLDTINEISSR